MNGKLWALLAAVFAIAAGSATYLFLFPSLLLALIIGVLVFVGFGPYHLLHA